MDCVLKYPGGKARIADWINSYFPPHKVYLEPFFGGGSVFLHKQPCRIETINDVDDLVTIFFRVVRDQPDELARSIYLTPFARAEYEFIQERRAGEDINFGDTDLETARRFAVRCWQGFGSKLADRVGWKRTIAANGPSNPEIWGRLPEAIIWAAERLRHAQIENTDAVKLIKAYNHQKCLIYADPPYLGDVRGRRIYRHEMTDEQQHINLLLTLKSHAGYVIISGYDCDLYNDTLRGWHKETLSERTCLGQSRQEVLWLNFEPCIQSLI